MTGSWTSGLSELIASSRSKKGKGKLRTDFLSGTTTVDTKQNEQETFRQLVKNYQVNHSVPDDVPKVQFGQHIQFKPPKSPFLKTLEQSTVRKEEPTRSSKPIVYDRDWLLQHTQRYASDNPYEACAELFTILRSGDEDIQVPLVELLGYEAFEFIEELISNRSTIVHNIMRMSNYDEQQQQQQQQRQVESRRPVYGTQLIIQSEKDLKQEKRLRKEQKKANKNKEDDAHTTSMGILGFDGQDLRQARENALMSSGPLFSSNYKTAMQPKYPHVYQSGVSGTTLSIFGSRFALPAGTERYDNNDYEETIIPVPKQAPVRQGERRIPISEMDSLARNAFKAYDTLNRVQSIVYPIAYETNENMLVCAPTGAGKTDVAMLTVLRCLSQHCHPPPRKGTTEIDFKIAVNEFKIVYVAPMKALAAEIVEKMQKRLKFLGVKVRELTGDMQLTKAEISETQFIVTTPEKWDVITRKGTGDVELTQKVKLLIIDEVHLLNEDRGAVIESIIARTIRQVESSQSLIRIVGLSATLPNYIDVATFLRVNPYQGLFYFDNGFRPVPLEQHFIGIKGKPNSVQSNERMNKACFDKVSELVQQGHQVMVFVHARKETVKTAQMLREEVAAEGLGDFFDCIDAPNYANFKKEIARSRNKEMKELFQYGFGIHHAGMLRSDRSLTERMFADGSLKVLCCTATLAWGVNLPAYAVVIKGTQVYDSTKGSFVDLSILDVLQIFGRAGRPQYETHGVGYILTTHDRLSHYISAITQQHPIESKFIENIVDNLNAEISLGTVTNIDEAVTWLSYTYLYVRMRKNPMVYGMSHSEPAEDPLLGRKRHEIITLAARKLAECQMILFDGSTGYLIPKDLGRIASNFYIKHKSIEIFNSMMKPRMTEADVLAMMSLSSEFDQIKSRETEHQELKKLLENACACDIKGGPEDTPGKVNILLQAYISNAYIDDFALVSDCAYVAQNAGRIARALFEIALNRNWGVTASVLLEINKAVEKRMWTFQHPLRQMGLPIDIVHKLENRTHEIPVEEMREMSVQELADLVNHNQKMGMTLSRCVDQFPMLLLDVHMAPITRHLLQVDLTITPDFVWNDRAHGSVEPWYIWAEDDEGEIYYSEYFLLYKKQLGEPAKLTFIVPLVEPLPAEMHIRAVSDRWLGAETTVSIPLEDLVLPRMDPQYRDLLDLQPLPISALHHPVLEAIYGFRHFNPLQTQLFHTLYHTQQHVLVGAPAGTGKNVASELALWAALRDRPESKVVYMASKETLVRERKKDWTHRFSGALDKTVVEIRQDVALEDVEAAHLLVTIPDNWNKVQWEKIISQVSCVIVDQVHLLSQDPALEVAVSRIKHASVEHKVRVVALSTSLADASDLANWMGVSKMGLFNFKPLIRPMEIYIDGFPGKHYSPRMAMMNKPTYAAIKTHAPNEPAIVFVTSRRQTKLTAQDLIAYCGMEDNPRQWLHMDDSEFEMLRINDELLRMTLAFGIGLYHTGLRESDRRMVEELYLNGRIQILIVTSDLAWQVQFPAHLVVIKGTDHYDPENERYIDYPVSDLLQMMGRASRPLDTRGVVRVFVQESKKGYYEAFLRESLPVESDLHTCLDLVPEVTSKRIKTKQDAVDYLTWTYMYRRLKQNPNYYGLDKDVNKYLSNLVNEATEHTESIEVVDNYKLFPVKHL